MNLTGDASPLPYIERTFATFLSHESTFNDDHGCAASRVWLAED